MDDQKQTKKPIKKAAAIRYDTKDIAPTVVAKGKGLIAENIMERVKDLDVPIYKDEALVEELTKIDLGDIIPPELYAVVAEIMVFVSDLDKMKDRINDF